MRTIRIMKEGKYFKVEMQYNEEFGDILDFAINSIIKNKIKVLRFGNHWQYFKYSGKLKAYQIQKKSRNQKSLIIKGNEFEVECLTEYWDEIVIRKTGIDIEEVGIYIDFQTSIWNEYKQLKKKMESSKTTDSMES